MKRFFFFHFNISFVKKCKTKTVKPVGDNTEFTTCVVINYGGVSPAPILCKIGLLCNVS